MHKKKFSDSQLELVALLPQGLPAMTDGAKLVLANIILWYGTEYAKENGCIFRTNQDMMKDCEIGSENTIIKAIKQLENLGLVTSKRGKRNEASGYRLSDEMLQKINFKPNETNSQSEVINSQSEVINQLIEQNKHLTLIISELQSEVKRLSEQVETLVKKSKCSTDTESDTDKNYYKSILTNGLLTNMENFTTNESEPTKEVENSEASAFSSFSSLNSEKENHADTNTNEDATPSTDKEPANDNTISASISSVVSELSEKPLYIQPLEENPPQIAPRPPFNDWFAGIKREIRQGIFQWSITLTDDVVKTDDANKIVHEVLTNHPEWENYVGQFSFCDLTNDTIYKMENRVKNADVRQAIKENQYQERHKKVMEQLLKTA